MPSAGRARPGIQYNEDEDTEEPSEVLEYIIGRVLRARRMIFKQGDPVRARHAFERAHKKMPVLLKSIHVNHGLTGDEIDQMLGTDFENFDNKLQKFAGKMESKEITVMARGDLEINSEMVSELREFLLDLRTLKRLLEGIEEGNRKVQGGE